MKNAATTEEQELLLEQLETLIQNEVPQADKVAAVEFTRSYYGGANAELLTSRHPPDLLQRCLAHYRLLRQARTGSPLVEVEAMPEGGGWQLRCVADDMPFLVDTLLIAVRRTGAAIRWVVHPVLAVTRGSDGGLESIGGESSGQESLVQIEFGGVEPSRAESLAATAATVLEDLRAVVSDYSQVRDKLAIQAAAMEQEVPGIDAEERAEIAAFLNWLDQDHFTFLGYIEAHTDDEEAVHLDAESGLGLWRASQENPITVAPSSEMRKYASSRRPLIITTTEGRSPIHHDEYCDVVVVKQYDQAGNPLGTARFLGLFSSEVYNTLPRRIPLVRRKIEQVMARSALRAGGHAAKQLRDILDNLPRNELFQSSVTELLALATGVRTVREAQQLRLFVRRDRYGRFYSCLIYQHRDRYSSSARRAMSQCMQRLLGGTEVEHEVSFQRDGLARLHLMVRTPPGTQTPLTVEELESRLQEVATRWEDAVEQALIKLLPDAQAEVLIRTWLRRVPLSYREEVSALEAATDLQYLNMAQSAGEIRVRLGVQANEALELKLYGPGEMPSLSLILPRLEHFGLSVLAQHPYSFDGEGQHGWIQHFDLQLPGGVIPERERRASFEEAFVAAWRGDLEADGLNALVLMSGLQRREVALTRALVKYAQQTNLPFSQSYIEAILLENPEFVAELLDWFAERFTPGGEGLGELTEASLRKRLDSVQSLDADRLLACLLSVVQATLRTNFYQPDAQGNEKSYISLKIRSADVAELPQPRPMVETFVYSPEVEGVHLRGGPVARGGLRWSDRREDFRTEVLGLVKAQMVKNAVIVPRGAKGGFVVKKVVDRSDRGAFQEAGIACYRTFISGLLDITDNLVDGAVVPPNAVRRHDDDDPYLVVAADKGTATFSDIANEISLSYGFWLGDAFASGGSDGYDHKKMGITARGAWESVKRHFREMGHDSQSEDFTVVGVGDMAGDVFGNGMLLSEHIQLVAAFNHLHIFIDPNPDSAQSFAERKRLFELPRSSWTDYNAELISDGGGIYERSAKSIALSQQAREALGIEAESVSPNELIHLILQAPVDLFWNGGIGTYVKAAEETHTEVGDRANDTLRINAKQLRVKVVGEGGNLGLTQKARIQAALNGCRVITDFNDNAGGVNSSDREVNLKIPLNAEVQSGSLALEDRNVLLESMTEELADKVLRDSDLQTQGICMLSRVAPARLDEHAQLIRTLERLGSLNRAIEFLPDEEQLGERKSAGLGLTMPELAVLVSYAKIDLFDAAVASELPDDPVLEQELQDYFPAAARQAHQAALSGHRLRREIIATVTTNRLVNRMGVSFARRVADEQQRDMAEVVHAWLAASLIIKSEPRSEAFEESTAPVAVIYQTLDRLAGLLKHMSLWLLAEHHTLPSLGQLVEQYAGPMEELEMGLLEVMAGSYSARHESQSAEVMGSGLESVLAWRHANHHVLGSGLDITVLCQSTQLPLAAVAKVYFELGGIMDMPWILEQINTLVVRNRWQAMARNQLREEAYAVHRQLCAKVLQSSEGDPAQGLERWRHVHENARAQVMQSLTELKTLESSDAAGLTVLLGQFRRLI